MAAEADEEALTLDCLPFDCIVCVCEFLPPEDLARFSAVCKVKSHLTARISIPP